MASSSREQAGSSRVPDQQRKSSTRVHALVQQFEATSSRIQVSTSSPQNRRSSISTTQNAAPQQAHIRPSRQARSTSMPPVQNDLIERPRAGPTIRAPLGGMNWEPIDPPGLQDQRRPSSNRARKPIAHVQSVLRDDSSNVDQHQQQKQDRRQSLLSPLSPSPAIAQPPSIRKVDAYPIRPVKNMSIELGKLKGKEKRYDGLPTHSGSVLPTFPEEVQSAPSSISSPTLLSPQIIEKSGSIDPNAKQTDDTPLLPRAGNSGRDDSVPSAVEAVPASQVFDHDALPLHLPDLDAYLEDQRIFAPPIFYNGQPHYTEEEARLYGLKAPNASSFDSDFEVCGNQITLPNDAINNSGLRKRKNTKMPVVNPRQMDEDEGQMEAGLLTKDEQSQANLMVEDEKHASELHSIVPTLEKASPKKSQNEKLQMFPPLMLLKDNTLDELKSNAVGPRKPPGGFIGSLPGLGSLLGTIVDFVVGVEGSTLAAGIFRLSLFMDFVQIMNLNTQFTSAIRSFNVVNRNSLSADYVLLHIVPSFMALNFVSVFGAAIILLLTFTGIVALLLISFWRMTKRYNPNRTLQGFSSQPWIFKPLNPTDGKHEAHLRVEKGQKVNPWRSTVWTKFANVSVVMLLTVLYIPLSKLSVDALVWSSDYWPTHNQASTTKPNVEGMCYKTNTDPDQFNWAFVIIPVAAITVIFYTLWFPYLMMRTISKLLPRVDEYNELGNKRTNGEMETEYMRLLGRDKSPLNFMYNAYRRKWGTYKPLYILCFKLSNLLVISIFTQQNCIFHKADVRKMLVIQQSVLIGLQSVLLFAHLSVQPFVDMISNRSELVSRCGYVMTAVIGLLVALQVKGSTVYQSALLYVVQALTYSGNIYFSLAGTSWMSHWIKRLQVRIDFSIDIFSPVLQLEKHIKRRIWQETLSTILLSAPEYRMPIGQMVTFSVDDHWPPYLLQFCGTIAERHIENLKIVKSVGMTSYQDALNLLDAEGYSERWKSVIKRIQTEFAGPDAYWQPLEVSPANKRAFEGVSSYFGKAFLIPFPPTLVISYDQTRQGICGATVQLTSLQELEAFVWQNESEAIRNRRWIRLSLRALDGQKVYCPHVETENITSQGRMLTWLAGLENRKDRYTMAKPLYYDEGILTIQRKIGPTMGDYSFESGFDVFVTYKQGQRRDAGGLSMIRKSLTVDAAAAFGLRDDFEYSPSLQQFFNDNHSIITLRSPQMAQILQNYRMRFYREALEKRKTMQYAFLTEIFDTPSYTIKEMEKEFGCSKGNTAVRQLPLRYKAASTMLVQRMAHVRQSHVHQWWYIFWDDFWRQNNGDYPVLRSNAQLFSPQYPTSIAYTPMSRSKLEELLKSRKGIWAVKNATKGIIDQGLLNRIYFMIDELAFNCSLRRPGEAQPGAGRGEPLVVGTIKTDCSIGVRSIETISLTTKSKAAHHYPLYSDPFAATSRHTGGGTDQDVSSIVERYAWPWTEQRLSGRPSQNALKRFKGHILEWLSIRPYKLHDDVQQLYIYLRIVDGRYEAASPRRSYHPI